MNDDEVTIERLENTKNLSTNEDPQSRDFQISLKTQPQTGQWIFCSHHCPHLENASLKLDVSVRVQVTQICLGA